MRFLIKKESKTPTPPGHKVLVLYFVDGTHLNVFLDEPNLTRWINFLQCDWKGVTTASKEFGVSFAYVMRYIVSDEAL